MGLVCFQCKMQRAHLSKAHRDASFVIALCDLGSFIIHTYILYLEGLTINALIVPLASKFQFILIDKLQMRMFGKSRVDMKGEPISKKCCARTLTPLYFAPLAQLINIAMDEMQKFA